MSKSNGERDSDSRGVHPHGMLISDGEKRYYDQPIDSRQITSSTSSSSSDTTTPKVLPYVYNKHFSKRMSLMKKYDKLGHAETYYNPAREALYNRYAPEDWHFSNQSTYNQSTSERNHAGKARANADWCIKETEARTKSRQKHVTTKLGERCDDIAFWGTELDNEIKSMKLQIGILKNHKEEGEKTLKDSNNPLELAKECLRHREKRTGIELVKDNVEQALNKECATIKKCQEKMQKLIAKCENQLKLDTAALNTLERDAQHKNHAHNVDNKMMQLNNNSSGIGYHPGIEYYDNTITVPISWLKFTQTNIKRAQKEREASDRLMNEMDETLRNSLNSMWNNFNVVNCALAARVRETTDARNKLLSHLKRTMTEIGVTEQCINKLRQSIRDKEAPMKVAQTRLDERSRRMNVELCNDPVMQSLQKEIDEIRESVRILKARLKPTDLSLARLIKTMTTLQHDMGVKENSLDIDSRLCLSMRSQFPMSSRLCPLTTMPLPT